MPKKKNKSFNKDLYFIKLAYEQAKINLGSTGINPSVGCIIEKNGTVISSGCTSVNGRPHAEYNALKSRNNFKGSNIYTTLEPCAHKGITPPCVNLILKKNIQKVFFSTDDTDTRTKKHTKEILKKNNIKYYNNIYKKYGLDFYSYYLNLNKKNYPLVDAKLAISKDYYTINKNSKFITNYHSRKRLHLLRSNYNLIISTSKSINMDNSLLNCRINGLENKSPDILIIDRNLKIFVDVIK